MTLKLTGTLAPLAIPAGLPASLIDRRPDVRQAEQQLHAAMARIGVAQGALLPTITLTGQYSPSELTQGALGSSASLAPTFLPLALPVTLLLVPIADLVLAVVRRTAAGRSPFAPDKQHLHHRLLEIGHSQRRAVVIMWMWAALIAGSTVVVSLYTGPTMWISLGSAAAVTVLLTFVLPVVHRPHLGSHPDD